MGRIRNAKSQGKEVGEYFEVRNSVATLYNKAVCADRL